MSRSAEQPLAFTSLYTSPVVGMRDYACHADRGGPTAEECADSNHVVLLRRGAFCKHLGRRCATADVNQAAFFSRGLAYRVSHPADCGDRGTVITPAPEILRDVIRAIDPAGAELSDPPFPFVTSPCDASVFWRYREFVRRLEETAPDPLWAEETALQLVADVLAAAFALRGRPRRHRRTTEAGHADLTEAAKAHLASRLGERVTLGDVARLHTRRRFTWPASSGGERACRSTAT